MIVNDIGFFLESFQNDKRNFKIRQSKNYSEIITDTGKKIMSNNSKFQRGLFLFMMVRRDVERYIKETGYIEPHQALPVNHHNNHYNQDQKTIGIDINNAYWSVACLKGYIRNKTYLKGLESKEFKPIRLSALSSLGKPRVYKVYEDGEHTKNEVVGGDKNIENFYLDIRYTTYAIMQEVATALGNDFFCWKTDCIFFKDTKENRLLVQTLLEEYGLDHKIEK
jgi:hypothetical protein